MMNYQDDDIPLSDGIWCSPDIAGEATAAADDPHPPISMFSDYSKEDLFELVWQQGGGGGDDMMMEQAAVSCHPRLTPLATPVHEPEVLPDAPADDEMAAWLPVIAKVDENPHDDDGRGWRTPPEVCATPSFIVKQGMGTKDTAAGNFSEKAAARGAKRSHHGEQHNLTEKRRRCKINERLKTLQQLVPGCDKSNHASTLEHTIQYMKWLQHQVQAMSIGPLPVRQPAATTMATYPVAPPPAGVAPVVLGPLPMIPFRPLMPCVAHYPAPAVFVPAAAPPLYPAPAAAPDPGSAPATAGGAGANHGHKSRSTKLDGSRRSSSKSLRHRA